MLGKIRAVAAACAMAAVLIACADEDQQEAAVPPVELIAVDYKTWEAKRQAMVPDLVVVDLWATWCTPCLERFPHMVEMHHKFKDRGVRFVSLSLDDREDLASIEFARTFLKEKNATFENYLLDENIMDGFDLIGIQTVPAVNIYDRSGKLVRELNNNNPNDQFTDEDIENAVTTLLEAG